MKALYVFLISIFCLSNSIYSQSNIRNIDFGVLPFKYRWGTSSINYSLGFDWNKKNKMLTNELRYFSFQYNFYKFYKATWRIESITYGKGLDLSYKFLFIKPSINVGLFYSEGNNSWNGYSFTIGVHFNPRIQAGIKYKKIKFSLMANYMSGIGISTWRNIKGELNTIPNKKIYLNNEGLLMFTPCISIQI
ncbi:MAG: hypothetical protein RLZ33_468 [Bacteroidota bacterium]|jgi:hypothetical protein